VNAGGGSVAIEVSGGNSYTPGTRKTITVRVTDANARTFGFQVTARLASNNKTQGGSILAGDGSFVLCSSGDFTREVDKPAAGCPANAPIESISQTSPRASGVWTFSWDPPATDQGEIVMYVAGNGANGNGTNSGDRIYNANVRLAFQAAGGGGGGGARPSISQNGVVTVTNFGGSQTVAPGSLVEIYGQNLAGETRDWGSAFTGSNAPTRLGDVSVKVGGIDAFVQLISPLQVNVQIPGGLSAGQTTLAITRGNLVSDNYTLTIANRAPGLLAPAAFRVGSNQYVGALYPDGTFVMPTGAVAGVSSRPARANEIIIFYGLGFGAVTPAINPGVLAPGANALPNVVFRFGQMNGRVDYAGLAPGFVGLYQFNVAVPPGVTGNTIPVTASVDGVNVNQTLVTAIQ
jgi:uncharacterized protein (TIGR03437 family)